MTYILHIANKNYSSWSLRPWVLMTTVGIPFEEKLHRFPTDGSSSYPEFKAFSPTGYVPVLEDTEEQERVWDSLAIVGYLAERHYEVWPTLPKARTWARSATSEMHSSFFALRNKCGMNIGIRSKRPPIDASLKRDLNRLDELWGEGLSRFGGPFLAGDRFSAADAFFCPVAFRVQSYDLPLARASLDYVRRLLAVPAMKDWYAAGLAETFREPGHEAETAGAYGLIADYRAK